MKIEGVDTLPTIEESLKKRLSQESRLARMQAKSTITETLAMFKREVNKDPGYWFYSVIEGTQNKLKTQRRISLALTGALAAAIGWIIIS